MASSLLCSFLLLSLGQGDAKAYPRSELLIEASELAQPGFSPNVRILDTRSAKESKAGRIPGSFLVPIADWNKNFTAGPQAAWWEKELWRFGIDVNVPVIVYGEDKDDMPNTARAWWILRYWGVKDVRILNGGMSAWTSAKRPVEKGELLQIVSAKPVKLVPAEKRLATKNQVKDSLKDNLLQIIDARTENEFCGEVGNTKKKGAIPGAVNLEWKVLLDPKTQKFKSAAELDQIFKKAGIDVAKPSVAHCQSGGRSSVMVFAMELMGANDVRNYYLSWAEWGNADDTPVVVPPKKKYGPTPYQPEA